MESPSTSREVALEVLHRVDADRAWSGVLLRRTLDRTALPPAEAALATELVYGTLRHRAAIDWVLGRALRVPLGSLPLRIQTVLRLGVYQLRFLSRIPPRAACSEAVDLAKRVGHPGTVRLVNAVLRRVAAEPAALPEDTDGADAIAVCDSHPAWLVARWLDRFGAAETRALCRANNATPPSAVRLNLLRGTVPDLVGRLQGLGVETVPSPHLPEGRRITAGPAEARRAAYAEGLYTPQDEGAMLVARLVAPQPGDTVIDACAAPGGKTTHLAALMENRGRVIACDVHERKLEALVRGAARLGASIVEPRLLDAARLGEVYPEAADRVLLDAPCSGLGVLRRRPEIKWRVGPADLRTCAAVQARLLAGAAGAVRPGGLLVYSVCSCEPEEGPEVIASFLAAHPGYHPQPIQGWTPNAAAAVPGTAFLLPHRADTDGFFVATLRRAA